jgi:hypothetical protein
MPNHFAELRAHARKRRDDAIAQIRREYEENLAQIADLEQRLSGRPMPDRLNLSAAIESVIPRGEQFTIPDIMRSLESLDPTRVWCKATVIRHITKLRGLGVVRRLKRHLAGASAVYIWGGDSVEPTLNDRTLKEVILELVSKPMRTAEVVQAVLDAGWETTMIPAHFRTHVISRLRQAGFREKGGKWVR